MDKLGVIGMGNMAQALCAGFVNSGKRSERNFTERLWCLWLQDGISRSTASILTVQ